MKLLKTSSLFTNQPEYGTGISEEQIQKIIKEFKV